MPTFSCCKSSVQNNSEKRREHKYTLPNKIQPSFISKLLLRGLFFVGFFFLIEHPNRIINIKKIANQPTF